MIKKGRKEARKRYFLSDPFTEPIRGFMGPNISANLSTGREYIFISI